MRARTGFIVVIVLTVCGQCLAQNNSSNVLTSSVDQLFAVRQFRQVAIAPDGLRVAWVETLPERSGDTAIYVSTLGAASGNKPVRVSSTSDGSSHDEGHIAWAPDSKHLAFLSDAAEEGQSQLYVSEVGGGTTKLTALKGFLDAPQWSPDGKSIGILFTENAPRAAGPLMPMTPETGLIDDKIYEQRLTIVDAATGQSRQISPADMYVYEFDWSPDSNQFAVTAAHGAGDAKWYMAEIYVLAPDGQMRSVYKPKLQLAKPRWSPDGKSIAFIAGIMSDEGSTGGDIFLVPSMGGEARNVTPKIAASPNELTWIAPQKILFTAIVDGRIGVATLDVTSGKTSDLWSEPEVLSTGGWGEFGISLAADHKTSAVIRQSFSRPPEIWAGATGNWQQITHANDQLKPSWGEAKSIHWTSDKFQVQGWLLYPKDYDPKRRFPMVVCVHGGPAVGLLPYWPEPFFNTSLLSTQGYFVLYPNPRGSYGAGEEFTLANVKDFGYGDLRDILAGVNKVVKDLPVDNDRVGITG